MTSTTDLSFDNTEKAFALQDNRQLKKSLRLFRLFNNKFLVRVGSHLTDWGLKMHLPINGIVKSMVFNHFCGGESLDDCIPLFKRLDSLQVRALLNYGVEAKEREEDFNASEEQNLSAIRFAAKNKTVLAVCVKLTGLGSLALFEKLQAGKMLTAEETAAFERCKNRLAHICKTAAEWKVKVYIDAEESWIQNPIDELTDAMMEQHNKEYAIVYNTFQLYRSDKLQFLKESFERARRKGYLLGAKLVRGAYVEKEAEYAAQHGLENPIHRSKAATDADFDAAVLFCLENIDRISLQLASHNDKSCMLMAKTVAQKNIAANHPHIHVSQLQGMSDHITFNLAAAGFNTAKYIPYGPVRDVIPYLIRRAQENSSVDGQMGRELSLIAAEAKRRAI